MNKEFVPHEIALDMKSIGFNEPCLGYYIDNKFEFFADVRSCNTNSEFGFYPTTPTFSQAFRWFREKYKIFSSIMTEYSYGGTISAYHINGLHQSDISKGDFYTYEEAELACLIKLIKLVKK
jgi:hypothetical protein